MYSVGGKELNELGRQQVERQNFWTRMGSDLVWAQQIVPFLAPDRQYAEETVISEPEVPQRRLTD